MPDKNIIDKAIRDEVDMVVMSTHGRTGLAHVLTEIGLTRPWTDEEQTLADAIAARLIAGLPAETDCSYFDGLVSAIGVLSALDVPGAEAAVDRLATTVPHADPASPQPKP